MREKLLILLKALLTRPRRGEPPQDIAERNLQLRAFCDYVNNRAKQVEKAVVRELQQYGEYLADLSQSEAYEFLAKHRISTRGFARQIELLSMQIPGLIASEVSRHLTESDSEYQRIRKMFPGAEKEAVMQAFSTEVIQNAVEKSAALSERIIDEIQTEFFSLLQEELDQSQQQFEKKEQELAALRIASGDIVEQTRITYRAQQICQCCEIIEDLLR